MAGVRTESPEKIAGDLEQEAPETLAEDAPTEMPRVESTVSNGPVDDNPQQLMARNPDGTSRPATEEEVRMFERTQACGRELNALLDRHECTLDVSMVLTTRGVIPQIQVVPRMPQDEESRIVTPDRNIVTP